LSDSVSFRKMKEKAQPTGCSTVEIDPDD